MDVPSLLSSIATYGGLGVFVLLSIIQIAPIKVNPWSAIAKWIGNAMNKDIREHLDQVDKHLCNLEARYHEDEAKNARVRIIRFSDEILHDTLHSKEHFDQILNDCTFYEHYCRSHDDFENNIATNAIKLINDKYNEHLKNHDFL